jgi:limonene-1,2-epoxide hydrolase
VGDLLAEDCIYYDAPIGPTAATRGGRHVLALESLAEYTNYDGRMVGEGDTVMYEHSERWRWITGESVVLPFVSVHRVERGKVALWADYWDYRTLLDAPLGWQESLANADLSWIYDASGQV